MSPDMRHIAEDLFSHAAYEACARGGIGEEILIAARDDAIRAIRLIFAEQMALLEEVPE